MSLIKTRALVCSPSVSRVCIVVLRVVAVRGFAVCAVHIYCCRLFFFLGVSPLLLLAISPFTLVPRTARRASAVALAAAGTSIPPRGIQPSQSDHHPAALRRSRLSTAHPPAPSRCTGSERLP
ncbi:hypothetical protein BU14_0724s0002 [Porphyra umbilicalis]|uniref:Uncharacterized protein n=1 Tax=Porphyra umbilicalis TaxID=2786 RepID=A0A1X6NPL1_PORUM|nr:hypothetical protein BU14_0724s0002 [Porphyra umbilicalis]|eukprot:OSX70544.1 hypothetical protein BU14_0724s0002 [Porphyra umbilicalis]